MASATRKTVEKTITEDVVVLELTQMEAHSLRAMIDGYGENDLHWSIRDALLEPPFTGNRPIEVGDKVRITGVGRGGGGYLDKVGTVKSIDQDDPELPFLVDLSNDDWTWAKSVERVND